ncbi:hypothetical protein MKX03_003198 [Papaver bracteatum]|nr:hypothetical protein MKX03_003198 [Papaver bracteatum]
MDLRQSPPKSRSTASSSSTGGVEEIEVQEEIDNTNNHSSKQINNLISASFTPPKLKPNASSAKRPVAKLKPTPAPTATTTVEKSQVVEEEPKKKKKKNAGAVSEKDPRRVVDEEPKKKNNNAGAVSEKDPRRVWTEEDEILLLRSMADCVKRGENPNSEVFYEFIQPKISVDVSVEQIKTKIRHGKDRYEAKVKQEKEGKVLRFQTPHLQKCHELSKPIWGSGGEGSKTVVVENEDDLEIRKSERGNKRKAGSMRQTKDGNATGANEQLEEVDAVAEKLKAATVEKQDGAEGSEAADQANKKKQGKKVGDKKHGKAGAGDVEATADGQEEGKQGEKERSKKKKKKKKMIEVGNADNVLEKLKPTADKQQECLYQLLNHQCKEQLTKAPFDLESSLNEKTIQLIEPSKVMAYQQKWKEIQIAEMELFLKKNDLVREGSLMVLEAMKAPPS